MGRTLPRLISSALLLLLWPTVVIAYAQCYYPDGSQAKDYSLSSATLLQQSSTPCLATRHVVNHQKETYAKPTDYATGQEVK